MDTIKVAKEDLMNYQTKKSSISIMRDKIKVLEDDYVSIKAVSNRSPVQGGTSKQEVRLLNNIAEREKLERSIETVNNLVCIIEQGLDALTGTEQRVLELFYINRQKNHVEKLCEELNVEKTKVYELKDQAIRKFAMAEYGMLEL